MIQLPLGCYSSELRVSPKDWKNLDFRQQKNWYIYYRFYDPLYKKDPRYHKGKLVVIKGMNYLKSASERKAITATLIEKELQKLREGCFNPITNSFLIATSLQSIIEISTPFIAALEKAAFFFSMFFSSQNNW